MIIIYSEALNITFLAMLYGFGMPIMYPMAMIAQMKNSAMTQLNNVTLWR